MDNGSDLGSHDFYSPTGGSVISEEDVDDLILEITPPAAPVALNTFIPGHNLLRSTPNNSKSPSINEKPSDYQDEDSFDAEVYGDSEPRVDGVFKSKDT